jgi:diaminohydroxyphosphoribosylaminopyrimidine deaminase/5-amino-6-(5-phosphoribosylamino)uracil reductase
MDDEAMMRRALALAERGRGIVSPNPLVGAVLVREGHVVGEGWHEGPGSPHAEAMAIAAAGEAARGATLHATLEPCDHHGRTPPCTRAILEAGVARVVVAAGDPHPLVDGRGIARLREAGVAVEVGSLHEEAERQNEAFRRHVRAGLPFVVLKMAATLDGKVAARDGSSRWITGEAARAEVHRMRAAADAVVVGAGTALADDPALTVRDPGYRGEPVLRVLVDARGRVPAGARLFDGAAPTLVATVEEAPRDRLDEWRDAGADVVLLPRGAGGVSIPALFAHLGKRDVQLALVEGGPTLAWSVLREGAVNRLVLFVAPRLVGGAAAPGIVGGEGFAPIGDALGVAINRVERVGDDLKVEADVHRDR